MKFTNLTSVLAAVSLSFLSSCAPDWWWDSPGNFYAQAGWTSARYDSSGFPIYGFYNNRPVYGYTSAGLPVFSFFELTRFCIVPDWKPAPHYRGDWKYPAHIDRRATPPRPPQPHDKPISPKHPDNFSSRGEPRPGAQPPHGSVGIKSNQHFSPSGHIQSPNNSKLSPQQRNAVRPNKGNNFRPLGEKTNGTKGMNRPKGNIPSAHPSQVLRKASAPTMGKNAPKVNRAQHLKPATKGGRVSRHPKR